MKYNRNLVVQRFEFDRFSDGTVKSLPVDDFPVSDRSLYNDSGWPMSDISILDRFSREHRDRGEIERIARRLEELSGDDVNKGKTDEQLIRELRPHWVQTASEYAEYEMRLMSYIQQSTNTVEDAASDDAAASEPSPVSQSVTVQSEGV